MSGGEGLTWFRGLCPRQCGVASKVATVTHLLRSVKVELRALRLPIRTRPHTRALPARPFRCLHRYVPTLSASGARGGMPGAVADVEPCRSLLAPTRRTRPEINLERPGFQLASAALAKAT